jgi:ferredoxin
MSQWVDFNAKYSELWPNITQMRPEDVPADAEQWHGVADKMQYFSEEPGKGD